jgi:hypothetical protein
MKRIHIWLDEKEQIEPLKKISTKRINFSEHVRRAIDAYLAKRRKELKA